MIGLLVLVFFFANDDRFIGLFSYFSSVLKMNKWMIGLFIYF